MSKLVRGGERKRVKRGGVKAYIRSAVGGSASFPLLFFGSCRRHLSLSRLLCCLGRDGVLSMRVGGWVICCIIRWWDGLYMRSMRMRMSVFSGWKRRRGGREYICMCVIDTI
jgi:hypothetical protein